MVRIVNNLNEFNSLIASPQLVVVDFFAEWCGPCKMIAPFIEDLSRRYPDVIFAKVNVDNSPDVAGAMNVRAMPTFCFFIRGNKVDEMKGADKNKLESLVQTHKAAAGGSSFGSNFSTLSSAPAWDGVGQPPGVDKDAARAARLKMLQTVEQQQSKFMPSKPAPAPAAVPPIASPPTAPVRTAPSVSTASTDNTPMDVDDDDDDALLAQALAMSTGSEMIPTASKSTSSSAPVPAGTTTSSGLIVIEYDDAGEPMVAIPVDESILSDLINMGFADTRSRKAIHHGKSLEKALEWLDAHQDDADIDQPYLVRQRDAEREIARLNAPPLTAEEKLQKAVELKQKIAQRKLEKAEQAKKDELAREKERRASGQKMNEVAEDRERMLRKREAERIKKEKDDVVKERARLKAEIQRDKELRKQHGGVLPSVLGVEGYNPSAAQNPQAGFGSAMATPSPVPTSEGSSSTASASSSVKAATAAVSVENSSVPSDAVNSNPITAEMLDKVDQLILTISRYRVGGDGGNALKLLFTFLNNVVTAPTDVKFRSINAESGAFKTKLVPLVGTVALLKQVGFVKSPTEEKYVLASANVMLLRVACTKLQAAMTTYNAQV